MSFNEYSGFQNFSGNFANEVTEAVLAARTRSVGPGRYEPEDIVPVLAVRAGLQAAVIGKGDWLGTDLLAGPTQDRDQASRNFKLHQGDGRFAVLLEDGLVAVVAGSDLGGIPPTLSCFFGGRSIHLFAAPGRGAPINGRLSLGPDVELVAGAGQAVAFEPTEMIGSELALLPESWAALLPLAGACQGNDDNRSEGLADVIRRATAVIPGCAAASALAAIGIEGDLLAKSGLLATSEGEILVPSTANGKVVGAWVLRPSDGKLVWAGRVGRPGDGVVRIGEPARTGRPLIVSSLPVADLLILYGAGAATVVGGKNLVGLAQYVAARGCGDLSIVGPRAGTVSAAARAAGDFLDFDGTRIRTRVLSPSSQRQPNRLELSASLAGAADWYTAGDAFDRRRASVSARAMRAGKGRVLLGGVDPSYPARRDEYMSLEDAARVIAARCDRALLDAMAGLELAVMLHIDAGVGKTSGLVEAITRYVAAGGLPIVVEIYVPSHEKADEVEKDVQKLIAKAGLARELRVFRLQGRKRPVSPAEKDEDGNPVLHCQRPDLVDVIIANRESVATRLCDSEQGTCPLRDECEYQRQFAEQADWVGYDRRHATGKTKEDEGGGAGKRWRPKRSAIVIKVHSHITVPRNAAEPRPNLVVVDENPIGAFFGPDSFRLADLEAAYCGDQSREDLLNALRNHEAYSAELAKKVMAGAKAELEKLDEVGPAAAPDDIKEAALRRRPHLLWLRIADAALDSWKRVPVAGDELKILVANTPRSLNWQPPGGHTAEREDSVQAEPLPILFLDATPSVDALQTLTGRKLDEVLRIRVRPNLRVTQVMNCSGGQWRWHAPENCRPERRKIVEASWVMLAALMQQHKEEKRISKKAKLLLVATTRKIANEARKRLDKKFRSVMAICYCGNLRGKNEYEGCAAAVILGRPQGPIGQYEERAVAFYGASVSTIRRDKNWLGAGTEEMARDWAGYRLKSGEKAGVQVLSHHDPRVEELWRTGNDELIQAIGRLRAVRSTVLKHVTILGSVPLDLDVDRLVTLRELTAGNTALQNAWQKARGVMALSPKFLAPSGASRTELDKVRAAQLRGWLAPAQLDEVDDLTASGAKRVLIQLERIFEARHRAEVAAKAQVARLQAARDDLTAARSDVGRCEMEIRNLGQFRGRTAELEELRRKQVAWRRDEVVAAEARAAAATQRITEIQANIRYSALSGARTSGLASISLHKSTESTCSGLSGEVSCVGTAAAAEAVKAAAATALADAVADALGIEADQPLTVLVALTRRGGQAVLAAVQSSCPEIAKRQLFDKYPGEFAGADALAVSTCVRPLPVVSAPARQHPNHALNHYFPRYGLPLIPGPSHWSGRSPAESSRPQPEWVEGGTEPCWEDLIEVQLAAAGEGSTNLDIGFD